MRITEVRAFYPTYDPPRPGWRAAMWQIGVEIETDAGIRGIGVGGGGGAAVYVINEHFRPLLVGREVVPARCYDLLFKESLPYGRKGIALMAISGVDLALWDLVARQMGKSVCGVLGCAPRAVPAYATGRDTAAYLRRGFRAIKLARPPGPAEGEGGIRWTLDWLREARDLGGEDIDLMVDAWMGWDVDFTLKMAELMAPFRVKWIEEPLVPDDYKGYERLCREVTTTKIAHGEHEFSEFGLREIIERGAVHILQPDLTWCGGMTPVLRLRRWAQNFGVPIIPHRGSEAWAYPYVASGRGTRNEEPLAEVVIGDGEFPGGDPPLLGAPRVENGMVIGEERPGFGVEWAPMP